MTSVLAPRGGLGENECCSMGPPGGHPVAREGSASARAHDAFGEYRRLVSVLASRAARLGSRDPEAAAQETLRRSLENPKSTEAVAYYLGENLQQAPAPEWPLDQLLAWLHGVLLYVVREEQARLGFRREAAGIARSEPADSSPGVLEAMVEKETRTVVSDCFAALEPNYLQGAGAPHGRAEVRRDCAPPGRQRKHRCHLGQPGNS